MSLQLLEPLTLPFAASIDQAIVETLAYSDVFDYPLRLEELHRYLPVRATLQSVHEALARGVRSVTACDGFYLLCRREAIIALRLQRETCSQFVFQQAVRFGRLLARLPFIRMVALTGSLALLNADASADVDYMLVTSPGRVWTARGFALLLGRLTAVRGYTLCPNVIVSTRNLTWTQRDHYSARELCQMIPIGGADTYEEFRRINRWTESLLPNASGQPALTNRVFSGTSRLQSLAEGPLRGAIGARLEAWEMQRKVQRFNRQQGVGAETRFNADTCQGNFNHHGAHTRQAFQRRLQLLGITSPLSLPAAPAE